MSEERKRKRKEIRHLQSESVWIQKAVFALRKAEAAREDLADVRDEDSAPYTIRVGDREVVVDELEEALDERAEHLIQTVRKMRRSLY